MKKALIVDDSTPIRKIARKMLTTLDFEIDEACDGKQALEKCSSRTPDLIILDWNMPVMDGIEFLKNFRIENSSTTVIFCTTNNEPEHIDRAFKTGANEYIMKPFTIDILKDKLQQLGLYK